MNKLCSVLLPTRNRFSRCLITVESFATASRGRTDFEIILRLDDDDPELNQYLREFGCSEFPLVKLIIGNRQRGYPDVYLFMDECAKASDAKWLMQFNDDCVIHGPWLQELDKVESLHTIVQPEFHRLGCSAYQHDSCGPFVTLPNRYWEEIGLTGIPDPADTKSIHPLMELGWPVHYLEGITVHHSRDDNEQLAEHRKL